MRPTQLATYLVALCLAAAPMMPVAHAARATPAETVPRPASSDELAGYAEREEQAKKDKLEEFEGGRRGRGIEATTIIIVLLVVILVIILI